MFDAYSGTIEILIFVNQHLNRMNNYSRRIKMKFKLTLIALIILSLIALLVSGCAAPSSGTKAVEANTYNKILVAATFYPLYDLTKSIVGDKGEVYSIVPAGVEPHDYEPRPSDLKKLNLADAFVTLGLEFAELEQDLVDTGNPGVKVISASKRISLLQSIQEGVVEKGDKLVTTGLDSHIWLSPKNAQQMVLNIMTELANIDSANAEYYLNEGQKLVEGLKSLDQEFTIGLVSCQKNVILVNHNAFTYLGRDYGFDIISIQGLEPEVEPTPQQLVRLIEEAEEHDLKYIFYEELVDPRIAQTIAKEVDAQVLELNPLEGTADNSATYISQMKKNLKNLKIALGCEG